MSSEQFRLQVELLLDVLPLVSEETCFALKGGTAINLFVRDLPRLSVDIDLTYTKLEPREVALKNIETALHRIKKQIESKLKKTKVISSRKETSDSDMKLFVSRSGTSM